MGAMLRLFFDNLLPVFLAAGAGFVLAARMRVDPKAVTHVAFFVLAPCFVFRVIVGGEVGGEALVRMVGFTTVSLLVLAALAAGIARALGWPRTRVAAVCLVVMLPNAGNYGLSASRFAFGDEGLAHAGIYFVSSSILTFTLGILVASLGRKSLGGALAGLPKVPTIWAVGLAIVVVRTGWSLPGPVDRTVELLAQACIPVFLIVLGMQLYGRGVRGPLGPGALAVGMRLVGGAALGLVLAPWFGLEGPARQAAVLQSAMPAAVINIVIAAEYDVDPAFVTSAVVLGTLLSPLTLTPLLGFLGA